MKIRLKSANASERLFWQHRINGCRPPVPVEWVFGDEDTCDKMVWVISSEEALESFNAVVSNGRIDKDLIMIVTEDWQMKMNPAYFVQCMEMIRAHSQELLLESEYQTEQLYQSLFKPSGKSNKNLLTGVKEFWSRKPGQFSKNRGAVQPRLKLCVFGEAALAYELGAVMAMQDACRVLVMDLDRLQPSADVYTGVKPIVEGHYDFFSKTSATGINVLLDCGKKGTLHAEVFSKCTQVVKGYNRLEVLTGVYQQGDYEYYRAEDLKPIVDRAAGYYDVIIMRTNNFLYDGFTLMAMKLADATVAGIGPSISTLRAYRQMVHLLKEKQDLSQERQFWVMFEDKKVQNLELGFFESLAGRPCIGKVPVLEARNACASTGNGYLKENGDKLKNVYKPIVKALLKAGDLQ